MGSEVSVPDHYLSFFLLASYLNSVIIPAKLSKIGNAMLFIHNNIGQKFQD